MAVLNLEGDIELLKSQKEYSRADMIQDIVETGKPVIVASDRAQMSSTVRKIAQSLGAQRFTPEENLDKRVKKELGQGDNSHEIDASGAAKHAFNQLRKKIRKIKSYAERKDKDLTDVASTYFSPEPLRDSKDDDVRSEIDSDRKTDFDTEAEKLRSELGELRKTNKMLKQQIDDLKSGILNYDIKSDKIEELNQIIDKRDSEIEKYTSRIEELEEQKVDYIEAMKKVKEGYDPILKVNERSTVFHDNVIVEHEELKQKLLRQGYNARTLEEIEGFELENFVLVKNFPEIDNIADLIDDKDPDDG